METWLYELFICLLIPMAMLVNGILHLRRPPKSINWHYGYRTKRSMKSQEAWEFAQQHCGKMCCRWGSGMAVLVLIIMALVERSGNTVVDATSAVIGIVEGLILSFCLLPTERALERQFKEVKEA